MFQESFYQNFVHTLRA